MAFISHIILMLALFLLFSLSLLYLAQTKSNSPAFRMLSLSLFPTRKLALSFSLSFEPLCLWQLQR